MPGPTTYRSSSAASARRPPSRHDQDEEARRHASRVAGFLLLGVAVLSLVEHFLLARWGRIETDGNQSFITAGVAGLLGLALVQGSEGARKTALWFTGLGMLALLALIPFGYLTAPEAAGSLALLAGGGLLAAIGLAGLLAGTPSSGRVAACAAAFVAGSVGSVALEMWLVKKAERELRALLIEWSAPDTKIHDEVAGLDIALPEGWKALKAGNPIVPPEGVRAALAETTLGAVAAVVMETGGGGYLSPDDYLDRWFAARREKLDGLAQKGREDTAVGQALGRKMNIAWNHHGRAMQGFATAWKDGDRYFCFWGWTTSSLARAMSPRFTALEASLSFAAPVATKVLEISPHIAAACPLLSPQALATVVPSLPRDSSPDAYCRRGLDWAIRGQIHLPAAQAMEFRAVSQKLFAAMSERDRERIGQYLQRLRQGLATSPADDRQMGAILAGGLARLPEDERNQMRRLTALAIDVGRLF